MSVTPQSMLPFPKTDLLARQDRLRAKLKVILAKHFLRHRYDYREEWVGFAETVGRPGGEGIGLGARVAKALADARASLPLIQALLAHHPAAAAVTCTNCRPSSNWSSTASIMISADMLSAGIVSNRGVTSSLVSDEDNWTSTG